MRRFLNPEIALGFVIATVFWAGILGWQAAYAPTEAQKQECYEAAKHASQKTEECKTLWERTTSDPVAFFTFILAVSTVGLWIATIFLYLAGERQMRLIERNAAQQASDMQASIVAATTSNQIAVTNAEQQLRAYVTAEGVSLDPHRQPGQMGAYGPMEGRVHTYELATVVKNGGQTPAINVVMDVSCRQLRRADIPTFDFPDSGLRGHGLIGPQASVHSDRIRIAANELEQIAAETGWYFWGWIEYDDIFSGTPRHRTEFCFEIVRNRLPVTNEFWIGFIPQGVFNAMDGGCRRPAAARANEGDTDR